MSKLSVLLANLRWCSKRANSDARLNKTKKKSSSSIPSIAVCQNLKDSGQPESSLSHCQTTRSNASDLQRYVNLLGHLSHAGSPQSVLLLRVLTRISHSAQAERLFQVKDWQEEG
jgi:hypothetical protein